MSDLKPIRLHESTNCYTTERPVTAEELLEEAQRILACRVAPGELLSSTRATGQYLIHQFAGLEHEVFGCLFLDNRHRLIAYEEMFRGTIDGAAVYPREVAKTCLRHNAAAVILAHNHPSGVPEPSRADTRLTERLQEALGLLDVRVLDHLVVGGTRVTSFAERGLI